MNAQRIERHHIDVVDMLPALRAFSRTFCRNSTDADDLVQETVAKALNAVHGFEPGTRLKSWLFTIMRNTFYTEFRKRRREQPGAAECIADNRVEPARQETKLYLSTVREAIVQLPSGQRELLLLVTCGTTYEEAAEIFGCNIGTVKSRLSRARSRLASKLGIATFADIEFAH